MAVIATLNTVFSATTAGFDSAVGSVSKSLSGLKSTVMSVQGAIGGLAAGFTIAKGITAVANSIERVGKSVDTAANIGTTVASLTSLQYAGKLAGVESDAMAGALGKLNIQLGKAAGGSKPAAAAFSAIGLNASELAKLPLEDAFARIANGIEAIPSPAAKASAAVAIFGKSGTDLIGLLSEGGESISKATDEFKAMGGALSDIDAQQVANAGDAIDKIGFAFEAVAAGIAVALAPAIQKLVPDIITLAGVIGPIASATAEWAPSLLKVGGAVVAVTVAFKAYVLAQKALAASQSILLSLTGPAGWKVLAAGAAIATASLVAIDYAYGGIIDEAKDSVTAVQSVKQAVDATSAAPIEKLSQAYKDAAKSVNDMGDDVRMQIATVGLDEAQKKVYEYAEAIRKLNIAQGFGGRLDEFEKQDIASFRKEAETLASLEKQKKIKDEIRSLELSAKQAGGTAAEKELLRLRAEGASRQQLAEANTLLAITAQREAAKQVRDIQFEAAQAGLSANEQRLQQLKREGASVRDIAEARSALNEIDAANLNKQFQTPLAKYKEAIAALEEKRGLLDAGVFTRAKASLLSELDNSTRDPAASARVAALERGTAAAYAAERESPIKTQKEILAQAKRHTTLQEGLLAAFKEGGPVPVNF